MTLDSHFLRRILRWYLESAKQSSRRRLSDSLVYYVFISLVNVRNSSSKKVNMHELPKIFKVLFSHVTYVTTSK